MSSLNRAMAVSIFLLLLVMMGSTRPVQAQTATPDLPVVHAVMFWKVGCHFCEQTLTLILPPIQEQYGAQFDLLLVQVVTQEDAEDLYRLAASFNIPRQGVGVPFLIIGDTVMMGPPTIHDRLPLMIDRYLAEGGMGLPQNPILMEIISGLPSTATPGAYVYPPPEAVTPALPVTPQGSAGGSNGFILAVGVMIGIALTLVYALAAIKDPKVPIPSGRWLDTGVVILSALGLLVAGYLSYIEIVSARAICGPIGDCNTVQSSSYARLFGVLPIGVLGMTGYGLLLAALALRRYVPRLRLWAAWAYAGMAFFGTAFSFYLTYLERFVIQAVCIWCITSAVIMTLLLVFGVSSLREANILGRKEQ